MMNHLRKVVLQDAVLLMDKYPNHDLFGHPIFRSESFREYATNLKHAIDTVPAPIDQQFRLVVPQVAAQMEAVHANHVNLVAAQQRLDEKVTAYHAETIMLLRDLHEQNSAPLVISRLPLATLSTSGPVATVVAGQALASLSSSITDVQNRSDSQRLYSMNRSIFSFADLWREFTVGLGGGPSINDLEAGGTGWCATKSERRFYQRRYKIISYINHICSTRGVSPEDVIRELDERRIREGLCFNKFNDEIRRDYPFL